MSNFIYGISFTLSFLILLFTIFGSIKINGLFEFVQGQWTVYKVLWIAFWMMSLISAFNSVK